jgi:hypothetical protein
MASVNIKLNQGNIRYHILRGEGVRQLITDVAAAQNGGVAPSIVTSKSNLRIYATDPLMALSQQERREERIARRLKSLDQKTRMYAHIDKWNMEHGK